MKGTHEGEGLNRFLFNRGLYLKNKYMECFENDLIELNDSLDVPLPEEEIEELIEVLKREDHTYIKES